MARPSATRRLTICMNGEPVGTWTLGRNNAHTFAHDDSWLTSPAARPISLSMPLRPAAAPYRGSLVENWLDNLLPDSPTIRSRIQARFGAASGRAFELLAEVGMDCVGAVQLLPEGMQPTGLDRIEGEARDDEAVADILRNTPAMTGIGRRYRMTPLYDVLSSHPILGDKAGQLAPEKTNLPMAAVSRNRHYAWTRILPRHWDSTARACGLSETSARAIRAELAERAPEVVSSVAAGLPAGFPEELAANIFSGTALAARALAN